MPREDRPTLDMPLKDITARWPRATEVLAARGLDLCCGGVHPLGMAARAHGLDPERILAELLSALEGP